MTSLKFLFLLQTIEDSKLDESQPNITTSLSLSLLIMDTLEKDNSTKTTKAFIIISSD